MFTDETGCFALITFFVSVGVSALVSATVNVLGQLIFDGKTFATIDWVKVGISAGSGALSAMIPGSGFLSIVAQSAVSAVVENGLNSLIYGDEFSATKILKETLLGMVSSYAVKGVTHFTSKLTKKIFIKAPNYSQYQGYFRKQGFDYSMEEASAQMAKHWKSKNTWDSIIEKFVSGVLGTSMYAL